MTNPRRNPSGGGRWSAASKKGRSPGPSEWPSIRDRVDLADVARRLMGDPPGRQGERGRRLWWKCPFHEDRNPSFCVEPGRSHWKCFGCGERGDAVSLVMKHRRVTFREAVGFIAEGGPIVVGAASSPPPKPRPAPADDPGADARQAAAMELVDRAAERLWNPSGKSALNDLRDRGLSDSTIRLARLGWAPEASPVKADGGKLPRFRGITIPWFSGDGLELVKVRQPRGCEPRYAEVYRRRPTVYPGPPFLSLPHRNTVIVVEGEFDALLLAQELESLAVVITTGSASSRPCEGTLRHVESAYRLCVATDADEAGDRSAAAWPMRGRRVRPPSPHKDWTEAHLGGFALRSWWMAHLMADPHDAEERAAILEHDGGLTREAAERAAGLLPFGPDDRGGVGARPGVEDDHRPYCKGPTREERLAIAARGDILRAAGLALPLCWIPEPQERHVWPPEEPYRREDGKQWFE